MAQAFNSSQEVFGTIAGQAEDRTIRAGRYSYQKAAERRILGDLLPKLQLQPHHRVLDIGCGSGLLVIPFAQLAEQVVGLDHPDVVAALGRTINLPNIELIGGGFPATMLSGTFDRIVAYSVMQCNPDYASALAFVRAAAGLLSPEGRLVIADIPNADRRGRFRASVRGQAFETEWIKLRDSSEATAEETEAFGTLATAGMLGQLTDAQIFDMASTLRADGYDVWIMPQSPDLPFGNTREDMVIVKP